MTNLIELYRRLKAGDKIIAYEKVMYQVSRLEENRVYGYILEENNNFQQERCITMDLNKTKSELKHFDGTRVC